MDIEDCIRFVYGLSGGTGVDFGPIGFGVHCNYGLVTDGKERDFLVQTTPS